MQATDIWRTNRLLAKLRRDFPEARRLPNRDLFVTVTAARAEIRRSIGTWILCGLAAFCGGLGGLMAITIIFPMIEYVTRRYITDGWIGSSLLVLFLALPTTAAVVAGQASFAQLVWNRLQSILRATECTSCGYSFAGLASDDRHFVQCPECGCRSLSLALQDPANSKLKQAQTSTSVPFPAGGPAALPVSPHLHRRFRRVDSLATLDDANAQAVYLSVVNGQNARWSKGVFALSQGALATVAFVAGILVLDPSLSPFSAVWSNAVAIMIMVMSALAILKLSDVRLAKEAALVSGAMIARDMCHACGYSLSGIVPNEHGLAPCPECLILCRPSQPAFIPKEQSESATETGSTSPP